MYRLIFFCLVSKFHDNALTRTATKKFLTFLFLFLVTAGFVYVNVSVLVAVDC